MLAGLLIRFADDVLGMLAALVDVAFLKLCELVNNFSMGGLRRWKGVRDRLLSSLGDTGEVCLACFCLAAFD